MKSCDAPPASKSHAIWLSLWTKDMCALTHWRSAAAATKARVARMVQQAEKEVNFVEDSNLSWNMISWVHGSKV